MKAAYKKESLTLHPSPYTRHPAPHTLRPTPYTLHPIPQPQTPAPHRWMKAAYTIWALSGNGNSTLQRFASSALRATDIVAGMDAYLLACSRYSVIFRQSFHGPSPLTLNRWMKAAYKKGALPGSLLHPLRNVELLQGPTSRYGWETTWQPPMPFFPEIGHVTRESI